MTVFSNISAYIGSQMCMFKENKGFVQGVAWDPLQKYVATLSSDRLDS